jgi:hypothetical protein
MKVITSKYRLGKYKGQKTEHGKTFYLVEWDNITYGNFYGMKEPSQKWIQAELCTLKIEIPKWIRWLLRSSKSIQKQRKKSTTHSHKK